MHVPGFTFGVMLGWLEVLGYVHSACFVVAKLTFIERQRPDPHSIDAVFLPSHVHPALPLSV